MTDEDEVLVIETTGTGYSSGIINGTQYTARIDFDGVDKRLASNYSITDKALISRLTIATTSKIDIVIIGLEGSFFPAYDDFIGDHDLGLGGIVRSNSILFGWGWTETNSVNDSGPLIINYRKTMSVASSKVTVSVPAGTFECLKVTDTTVKDTGTSVMVSYFSSEVGNYVKIDGCDLGGGVVAETELASYSFAAGRSGILAALTENLYLAAILAAVASGVVVGFVLLMRKRRPGSENISELSQTPGNPPPAS